LWNRLPACQAHRLEAGATKAAAREAALFLRCPERQRRNSHTDTLHGVHPERSRRVQAAGPVISGQKARDEENTILDIEKQREQARQFLENFNHVDPRVFEEAITDDFTFAIVSSMAEFPPLKGRREFVEKEVATLRRLFPQGLNMTIEMIICEGPHVAALARCDTIAYNGRRYQQRYHFYLRFDGELIAEGREYNDTDLIRQVFLA
jgi:ketosteroid isomerase-like protein